jgi:hypothetical protein
MTAKWTWLVYMAGDNNLESQGPIDLREMQRVGSSADVNIIVQFDTERQRTIRYRSTRGASRRCKAFAVSTAAIPGS